MYVCRYTEKKQPQGETVVTVFFPYTYPTDSLAEIKTRSLQRLFHPPM